MARPTRADLPRAKLDVHKPAVAMAAHNLLVANSPHRPDSTRSGRGRGDGHGGHDVSKDSSLRPGGRQELLLLEEFGG